MMLDGMIYKVLWVDDQEDIVESTKLDADEYGIELDHYSNWQDAEAVLKNNFDDYTGIILDAYCKIKPTGDIKEEFINAVLPSLARMFGEKKKFIPWYILSAGTMNYFSHTVQGAEYQHQTDEWGPMLYIKDVPDDDPKNIHVLYKNIRKIGKEQANNIVLFRHRDVFSYLGKNKLIDERARKIMLKMLSALYIPENNTKYEYEGNPLRKVVEYIFWAARKKGLLPNECFEGDVIKLQLASLYMAGANISFDRHDKSKQVRWGTAGFADNGRGGDSIIDKDVETLVKNILEYTNKDSHTSENEPWYIDEDKKELFFGYVLQLCHVIKWFGKYATEHPNVIENKKMQRVVEIPSETSKQKAKDVRQAKTPQKAKDVYISTVPPSTDDLKGRKYLISKDGDILYCGSCKLDPSLSCKVEQIVTIVNVKLNEGEDKDKFPYIAIEVE